MFSDVFTGIEKRKKLNNNELLIKVKPVVDIYENDNSIIVIAEIPNVSKKNLSVTVENGMLYITGKRLNEDIEGNCLLRETKDLVYERIFEMEDDLDSSKIEAHYHSGILKITIGKKQKVLPKRIDIK